MFSIIALPFDAYAALPCARGRWLLTCLARYANRAGEAWPTMRALAKDAAMSLASVSRHLKAMAEEGVFQRERLPGGGRYRYTLAEPYRLRWPRERERVPQVQNRVPQAGTRDEARPEKHERGALARTRFAKSGIVEGGLPDPADRWQARVRSWIKSGGKFWLAEWGPCPNERGCLAPPAVLQAGS